MPARRPVRLALAFPLVALAACASGARGTNGTGATGGASSARGEQNATDARAYRTREANLLTAEEIGTVSASSAYHAVQILRPAFLRARNPRFPIVVYVNGARWGGLDALTRLQPGEIASVRRLTASEAQTRYGQDLLSGVLEVTTAIPQGS